MKTGYLKPIQTSGGFDAKITFQPPPKPGHFTYQILLDPQGHGIPDGLSSANIVAIPSNPAGIYVFAIRSSLPQGDVDFLLAVNVRTGT